MDIENNSQPIIIGYYPFRAKAQVDRLVCEYLHLNYRDRFFNPDQWNRFKETQGKDWVIKDLPFLQDGDFTVTGPIAIATYLVQKSGKQELFGKSIEDKAKIDNIRSKSDLRTALIAMKCVERQGKCQAQKRPCMAYYWQKKIKPILNIYEQQTELSPWFLSYVTIVDFVIYEVVNQLQKLFPQEIGKFKKLKTLRDRVSKIPEIEEYEKSERAVKEYCPLRYFNSFKEEKLKSSRGSSSANSTSSLGSCKSMDLE